MLSLNKFIVLILINGFAFCKSNGQNLIKNGSFELFNTPVNWSNYGGGFYDPSVVPVQRIVLDWETFNSPDYFTTSYPYTNGVASIPSNWFGNSYAKSGNGYAGLGVFQGGGGDYKEYIYQQLSTPLKTDSAYCLSFFVTLADRLQIAVKEIGAYFSATTPTLVTNYYINAIPQVAHVSGFITDTVNWTEVRGCFIAQGGENYITIGGFGSAADTDTLRTTSTNPLTGTGSDFSYYYIDSVTLWKNNFPTGINETSKENSFSVYPNPNAGTFEIQYFSKDELPKNSIVQILNPLGQMIQETNLEQGKAFIDLSKEREGVYFYRIVNENKILKTDKIVIIK